MKTLLLSAALLLPVAAFALQAPSNDEDSTELLRATEAFVTELLTATTAADVQATLDAIPGGLALDVVELDDEGAAALKHFSKKSLYMHLRSQLKAVGQGQAVVVETGRVAINDQVGMVQLIVQHNGLLTGQAGLAIVTVYAQQRDNGWLVKQIVFDSHAAQPM